MAAVQTAPAEGRLGVLLVGLGAVSTTLGSQIANSVRWLDSMIYMLDHGVTEFQEIGPGTVLAKLAAQIRKKRPA